MRVLLSFMPVLLMAGRALPDEVDTSLGTLVKSARLTTRGEIGSRGSGKPTSFPGEINPHLFTVQWERWCYLVTASASAVRCGTHSARR